MRTPLILYGLALAVRLALIGLFPDPAYPDSYYYVEVARALAAGHGLNVPFVWIFAEVGNRIPDLATLPVPSNAHWLPLASFAQVPFIALLGPTAFASALPIALIGATAAPLTWAIAKDAGARPVVGAAAGVLAAIPAAGAAFQAQPENFGIVMPLVAAALWLAARGLRGHPRSFALAGLLVGLATFSRNDGILLAGALGLIWLGDRVRWWLAKRRRRRDEDTGEAIPRRPIPVWAAAVAVALFLAIMVPWWVRQLAVFGSISPTSSSGAALWIRQIAEWNSITAEPSLGKFLAQGLGPIVASRVGGFVAAVVSFSVIVCSVILVPLLAAGAWHMRRSRDFTPWIVYAAVLFAGATLLYPVHVPGGTFIHGAIGLAPHAYILSMEGVLVVVAAIARRRSTWHEATAGPVFVWAVVAIVVGSAAFYGAVIFQTWDAARQPRIALAAEMTKLGIPAGDRILGIDAAGYAYWTGHPGVVTPDDPIATIEQVARAYDTRWLVLERDDIAWALAPILEGGPRPSWIGAPVYAQPSADGGPPRLALYPVCTTPGDGRCATATP